MKIIKEGKLPFKVRTAEITCQYCETILEVSDRDFKEIRVDKDIYASRYAQQIFCPFCNEDIILTYDDYIPLFEL